MTVEDHHLKPIQDAYDCLEVYLTNNKFVACDKVICHCSVHHKKNQQISMTISANRGGLPDSSHSEHGGKCLPDIKGSMAKDERVVRNHAEVTLLPAGEPSRIGQT